MQLTQKENELINQQDFAIIGLLKTRLQGEDYNHALYQAFVIAQKNDHLDYANKLAEEIDFFEIDLVHKIDEHDIDLKNYNPFTRELVSQYDSFPKNKNGHAFRIIDGNTFCEYFDEEIEFNEVLSVFEEGSLDEIKKQLESNSLLKEDQGLSSFFENLLSEVAVENEFPWYERTLQGKELVSQNFIIPDGHSDTHEVFYYHPDPQTYLDELDRVLRIIYSISTSIA